MPISVPPAALSVISVIQKAIAPAQTAPAASPPRRWPISTAHPRSNPQAAPAAPRTRLRPFHRWDRACRWSPRPDATRTSRPTPAPAGNTPAHQTSLSPCPSGVHFKNLQLIGVSDPQRSAIVRDPRGIRPRRIKRLEDFPIRWVYLQELRFRAVHQPQPTAVPR